MDSGIEQFFIGEQETICAAMCPTIWKTANPRAHHAICEVITDLKRKGAALSSPNANSPDSEETKTGSQSQDQITTGQGGREAIERVQKLAEDLYHQDVSDCLRGWPPRNRRVKDPCSCGLLELLLAIKEL